MKKILFLFLILAITISCNRNSTNLKTATLRITDTLIAENKTNFFICDYSIKNKLYLGYSFWASQQNNFIYLVDDKLKDVIKFNKCGSGPEEYERIRDVKFYNDTTIVVFDNRYAKFYNLSGNYLKTLTMDTIFFPGARNNFSIYRNKNNEINFFYRFTKDEFTGSKSYYDDSSRKFFINYSSFA